MIISGTSTSSATPCPTSPTPTSSGVLADHLRVPSPQDRSQEPKDNEGATHNIATRHASGEEVVRAIIDRNKGKAKRGDTTIGEGGSDCFQKKSNRKVPRGLLVVAAERMGGRSSNGNLPNFFEKKLEGAFSNHAYHVKHAYKDRSLIRRFLAGGSKHGGPKEPGAAAGEAEAKEDNFPEPDGSI